MSDEQEEKRYPRSLRLHCGCLVVAIPPQIYRRLGWAQGNWVTVRQEGSEVVLSHLHLGQSSEPGELHKRVPLGKHGARFRKENEERKNEDG